MAKSVADLEVALNVKGIEGLDQLKSAFRGLSKAAGPADNDLEKLAQGVKAYSRAGKESRDVVAGQVNALKNLRSQAGLGGKAFVNLTKDIINYEKKLASADLQIERTTAKFQTLTQVSSQIPARRPDAFASQIAVLNAELADASVAGEKYGQLLRQIQERTLSFQRAQARQVVIARAETGAKGPVDPRTAFTVSKELPSTTAALSLRVSELKDNLQNLDFTSDKYSDTQREILSVEKQLEAIGKKRIEVIKGVTDQQRRAEQMAERSRGRKQRLGASQAQTIADDAASLAARRALPGPPVREISGLYQSIGNVGMSKISADIDRMGKSYSEVANDIRRATLASNGSIKSLQSQGASWRSLRDGLDPASKGYRKIGREIDRVDKKLAKLSKTSRFTKGQFLQGAGAVASASIFGGPLGALGGLLGFAAGGPAGAAVGGGIGASANILVDYGRQIAELNTQLNLSKQTLALAANGQEEYNKLLGIARSISKDYAVGLKETIGGFSQVAVAARANNLTLQETETIYRGLVSSGIAFGKSQQDIDAIVRATVQVLSKGKLSAEELQGQIGERLPGAVAKFAEATGRTLPQLAKDLKAGTVQISDFVDFSKKQLFDYDKVAQLIADGPEKAGARLKLALEEAAENYGGFFQRAGAGFQDLGTFIVTFFNDNQEIIENFVVDSIIAFKNLALEVKLAFEDIKQTLGFFKPVLDAFNLGIETVSKASRRQQALKAGGFDDAKYRQESFERVSKQYSPIFQPNKFKEEFFIDFNRSKGDAVRRGEPILREQTGDTVPGREQLRKQLFGEFTPYSMGNYKKGSGTSTDTDPDGGGTTTIRKDISDLALKAGLANLATKEKGFALDAVGIELQKEKLHLQLAATVQSTAEMRDNEQILAVATARQTLMNGLFELNEKVKRQAEEDLKQEQEKAVALNEIKLITGEITQEEFDQQEIRNQAFELTKLFPEQLERVKAALEEAASPLGQFKKGLKELFESAMDLKTALGEFAVQAVDSFGDAFADFVTTGKANFADFTASILRDLAKIFARAALFKTLSMIPGVGDFLGLTAANGAVTKGMTPPTTIPGGVGAMAANGLAVARNGIVPYAKGGLVTKPTLFQYKQGGVGSYGLMGEAGTEAIMPLRRGANGKLGVEASGSGVGDVVVNVDAAGSSVEGNGDQAAQLGKAIGIAVQQELIKQKRPGGLLTS